MSPSIYFWNYHSGTLSSYLSHCNSERFHFLLLGWCRYLKHFLMEDSNSLWYILITIPWLLMTRWHKEPRHQQPWHWPSSPEIFWFQHHRFSHWFSDNSLLVKSEVPCSDNSSLNFNLIMILCIYCMTKCEILAHLCYTNSSHFLILWPFYKRFSQDFHHHFSCHLSCIICRNRWCIIFY